MSNHKTSAHGRYDFIVVDISCTGCNAIGSITVITSTPTSIRNGIPISPISAVDEVGSRWHPITCFPVEQVDVKDPDPEATVISKLSIGTLVHQATQVAPK